MMRDGLSHFGSKIAVHCLQTIVRILPKLHLVSSGLSSSNMSSGGERKGEFIWLLPMLTT